MTQHHHIWGNQAWTSPSLTPSPSQFPQQLQQQSAMPKSYANTMGLGPIPSMFGPSYSVNASSQQLSQQPIAPLPYMTPPIASGSQVVTPGKTPGVNVPGLLPIEESYIENILRFNLGKMATIYMTYEGNSEWNAKVYKGKIEAAGRDHIIISDPETGTRYLLLMVNLDYITFDEELKYVPPGQLQR